MLIERLNKSYQQKYFRENGTNRKKLAQKFYQNKKTIIPCELSE